MAETQGTAMGQVPEIVKALLERQLDRVRMVSVDVEEDYDADGDPVLHVTVVYESAGKRIGRRHSVGARETPAARALRTRRISFSGDVLRRRGGTRCNRLTWSGQRGDWPGVTVEEAAVRYLDFAGRCLSSVTVPGRACRK